MPGRRNKLSSLCRTAAPYIGCWLLAALAPLIAAEAENPAPVLPVEAATLERRLGKTAVEWAETIHTRENAQQVKTALQALLELAPVPASAAPDLLAIVRESADPELSRLAILALGAANPDLRDVEPALLGILGNILEAPAKRAATCRALIQIAPGSALVRKATLAAAADRQQEVRREAFNALIVLAMPAGPNAQRPAKPPAPLAEPLDGRENKADAAKRKTAPRTEAPVFPFPPALETLAKAALNARDAADAAGALRTLGDPGVEPLVRALEKGAPAARAAAAEALGGMRRSAKRALPALISAARDENDRTVRAKMAFAAANLDARDPAVLELLAETLGFESSAIRPLHERSASELLHDAGRGAFPGLRNALRSNAPETRLAALKLAVRFALPDGGEPAAAVAVDEVLDDIAGRVQDKDERVRLQALETLNRIGPSASKSLEVIQKARISAPDHSAERRTAALAALNVSRAAGQPQRVTPLDGESRDELITRLTAREANAQPDVRGANRLPSEREDAALALRLYGNDAKAADSLTRALNDPDPHVRRAAARALGCCGLRATGGIPTLTQWLESEPRSRAAAFDAFAGLGADGFTAAHALAKSAAEDTWPNEPEFETALTHALRAHAAMSVPALAGFVRNGAPDVRVRAARALGLLGETAATALPVLLELSKSADDAEAAAAFDAIRRIGPEKDADAAAQLAHVIRESLYATRREWAVRALAGVAEQNKLLIEALGDPDERVCRAAYSAVLKLGATAKSALAESALKAESSRACWALFALAELRAEAAIVIPGLAQVIDTSNNALQRATAADLLAGYGPAHGSAVPALLRLLRAQDDASARAAMRAIKALGVEARQSLERLSFDRDPVMRKRAAEALDSAY